MIHTYSTEISLILNAVVLGKIEDFFRFGQRIVKRLYRDAFLTQFELVTR